MGVPAAVSPSAPTSLEVAAVEAPAEAASAVDSHAPGAALPPTPSGNEADGKSPVLGNADGGLSFACLPSAQPLVGEALWESCHAELTAAWEGGSRRGDSLVIFDWDDTLLPTTALCQGGHFAPPTDELAQRLAELVLWSRRGELAQCAASCAAALAVAKQHGAVAIVTNALNGWVKETAARFMPQLAQELEGVPVISARSIFEPIGFANPWDWKTLCFERIGRCVPWDPAGAAGPRNLISIGDSWYERAAAIKAAQDLSLPCYLKCMKLVEQPSMPQLVQQLDQIVAQFAWVTSHEGPLDLWFPMGAPTSPPVSAEPAEQAPELSSLPPPTEPPPVPPPPPSAPPALVEHSSVAPGGDEPAKGVEAVDVSYSGAQTLEEAEDMERLLSVESASSNTEAQPKRSSSNESTISMAPSRAEEATHPTPLDSCGEADEKELDRSFSIDSVDSTTEGDQPDRLSSVDSVNSAPSSCRSVASEAAAERERASCASERGDEAGPLASALEPGKREEEVAFAEGDQAETPAEGAEASPSGEEALCAKPRSGSASPRRDGDSLARSPRRRKTVVQARVFTRRRSPCTSKRAVRTGAL